MRQKRTTTKPKRSPSKRAKPRSSVRAVKKLRINDARLERALRVLTETKGHKDGRAFNSRFGRSLSGDGKAPGRNPKAKRRLRCRTSSSAKDADFYQRQTVGHHGQQQRHAHCPLHVGSWPIPSDENLIKTWRSSVAETSKTFAAKSFPSKQIPMRCIGFHWPGEVRFLRIVPNCPLPCGACE